MKKIISLVLALCLVFALAACSGGEGASQNTGSTDAAASSFKAGFGKVDITPDGSVNMAGYGDHDTRFSEGLISYLEARAIALQDENGDVLLLLSADTSFAYPAVGNQVLASIEKKLGVPDDHVVISGTHTHNSVATWVSSNSDTAKFNSEYVDGLVEAAQLAIEDLKPTEVFVGSAYTENLNFVRRYIMDDGSLIGDGARGTGTTIVSHESEVDNELQLLKFVREGGKDILVANFQAHPHIEGKTKALSADAVGAFRDAMESEMDIHCMYWNGAAGNINSKSRIESENRTSNRKEHGSLLAGYAIDVYDSMTQVQTGPIKVTSAVFEGKVNHTEHDRLADALDVVAYFEAGHTTTEAGDYAFEKYGINSLNHAKRIIANAKLGETSNLQLAAFSFGDVSGIVLEYEMFDTNGMQIKERTPFEKTFIIGYSYPACQGYVASALGYQNGGYEVDNGTFAPGTGEELVEAYLGLLNELKQ